MEQNKARQDTNNELKRLNEISNSYFENDNDLVLSQEDLSIRLKDTINQI